MSVPQAPATNPTDPAAPAADPANPTASGQPNSNGTEPDNKPAASEFDPSTIKDEDFDKLFSDTRLYKHPRFKSLSERAKKADELEQAKSKAEEDALAEQGKWKELAEKREQEAKEANDRIKTLALNNAIQLEAAKTGVVDVEAVAALIDRSKVKVKDDGSVEGVKDALDALIESKPYLKGTGQQQPVGSGSNPNPGQTEAGTKKFKLSQLQDPKFWQENEKDIREAMKLGLVEDDVHGTGVGGGSPTSQQV